MTLVVAHRGASAAAPENTMEAFRLGIEAGGRCVELDATSRDGEMAGIHATRSTHDDRSGRSPS